MIRATDLIGAEVRSESGERLGRVHDLRARRAGDGWALIGLVLGAGGMLARLAGAHGKALRVGRVVPWEAIVGLEDGSVTVRDEVAEAP